MGWRPCICLHIAAYADMADILMEKGATQGIKDSRETTPLHLAVQSGARGIVQFLIDKGADTTIRDERGTTLIDIATTHGRSTCMKLLEKIRIGKSL